MKSKRSRCGRNKLAIHEGATFAVAAETIAHELARNKSAAARMARRAIPEDGELAYCADSLRTVRSDVKPLCAALGRPLLRNSTLQVSSVDPPSTFRMATRSRTKFCSRLS